MSKKKAAVRSFKAVDNLGLAYKVCCKYTSKTGEPVEGSEYLCDAYLALVRAEKSFDPDRGFAFSTYAWTAIEREIDRSFSKKLRISKHEISDEHPLSTAIDDSESILLMDEKKEHISRITKEILSIRMRKDSRRDGRRMMKQFYLEGKSLAEIAKEYGVSRQRVQQKIQEVFKYIRSRQKFKKIESMATLL